jgi:hypothetical protein
MRQEHNGPGAEIVDAEPEAIPGHPAFSQAVSVADGGGGLAGRRSGTHREG